MDSDLGTPNGEGKRGRENLNEKKRKSSMSRKSFHGKWKIEASRVNETYIPKKVVAVNGISCAVGVFFSLLVVSSSFLFVCYAMLCHAMCAPISLDVLYLIMCGNPFSNEHIAHTASLAANVHSGKGVRSLGKINVCST